ncbi:MAG: hypothetical protein IAA25_09650 [Candidatus Ruminococcus intestinipullorum]|nr:hypothetical protein [Candidatus Ruminococcus intestinipullorum]
MFGMEKTLIVVYKDEMLMNQLKKMVETNDDADDGQVIGTRDNSINIVAWTEKVWLGNKKAGNIKDKVLFLGDIKGTDSLIPVVDVKFDDSGVKFGWAGNQAVLFVNPRDIKEKEEYLAFIKKLAELPIPEIIKQPQNAKIENTDTIEPRVQTDIDEEVKTRKTPAFLVSAKEGILKGTDIVGKAGTIVVDKAGDLLRDKNTVRRQMLFYGVVNLYRNGLEEFMNA